MPRRRFVGIESKDFVRRTGPFSKKRARLLEKLQSLIGRARFLAVREQIPNESDEEDTWGQFEPERISRMPKDAQSTGDVSGSSAP